MVDTYAYYLHVVHGIASSACGSLYGYAPIVGVTQDGYSIAIDFNERPVVSRWINKGKKDINGSEMLVLFPDEPCEFSEVYPARFSCSAKGKSPLAGTTYVFKVVNKSRRVKNACGDFVPESHFVCVAGCSAQTPKFMDQDEWEC